METKNMIEVKTSKGTFQIKDEDFINRGEWFGKTWVLGIGCGISTFFFLVEAGCEGDVIDTFVDSDKGHWLKVEGDEEEWHTRAGNFGELVNLSEVRILERVQLDCAS
jgi:hypothetical protein